MILTFCDGDIITIMAILYGDEIGRVQSRNSTEFVVLLLTPLNFTEFSGCSPLNSAKPCLYIERPLSSFPRVVLSRTAACRKIESPYRSQILLAEYF